MLQGITEEAKKQAEQRISNPFVLYLPVIRDLALKKTQRSQRVGKSEESQKLKRGKDYFDSAQKHNCGTIVERYSMTSNLGCVRARTRMYADWYERV